MPKITVIVPVYKVEKYIHRCVDSILSQSFGDFDLVLADDGSPDTCPEICDAYARQDDRVVVIHKKNGGLSDARNAGIDWAMENSDSSWLAFVDSDDYLHPDYLQTLYQTAKKEEADLVICDFVRVNDAEESIEKKHSFPELCTTEKNILFEQLSANWRIRPAWNKLYHKRIFEHLRFAFGKIHEDEFAIHHVLWNCGRAALIRDGLYYYRIRENSIMMTESSKSRLDRLEALIDQFEFCLKNRVQPNESVAYTDYMNQVLAMKADLDKQDLGRYRQLKKRYAAVFFCRKRNRTVKRFLGFYCNRLYRARMEKSGGNEEG